MAVVFDAVDEIARDGTIAVGLCREVARLGFARGDQLRGGLTVEVGPIHLARGVEVPRIGLRIGDLPPASHLRKVPDRVAVVRVRREVAEEHVEVGNLPFVAALEFEHAGERVRDDRVVGAELRDERQRILYESYG